MAAKGKGKGNGTDVRFFPPARIDFNDPAAVQRAMRPSQSNREAMHEIVGRNGMALQFVEQFRADREISLFAVGCGDDARNFRFVADELQNDRCFVLDAVARNYMVLEYVAAGSQADREIALAAITRFSHGFGFTFVADELKADRSFVLEAVRKCGAVLQHAPAEFRADPEIVLQAVKAPPCRPSTVFSFAAEELKGDAVFALEVMAADGSALAHVAAALRTRRDLAIAAVRQWGGALQFAPADVQADREVVLEAVRKGPFEPYHPALQSAAHDLRADRDVVLQSVKCQGDTLQYAAADLRSDHGIVLAAVKQSGLALQHAAADPRGDHTIVLAALGQQAQELHAAATNSEIDLWFERMYDFGTALRYAADELRRSPEFMLAAVREHGVAIRDAAPEVRLHGPVVLEAVRQGRRTLRSAAAGKRDILHEMMCFWGTPAAFAAEELRNDEEFMLAAVREHGLALKAGGAAMLRSRGVVLEAVREDGAALQYADEALHSSPELQPEQVARNHLAGPGASAPTFTVLTATDAPAGGIELSVAGLHGEVAELSFASDATLGDVATAVMERFGVCGDVVHLLACGRAWGPLQVAALLREVFLVGA